MKWGKIAYFREHSRIDYNCEDALLELYGKTAEEFILAYISRTYENLIDLYGEIPARIYDCTQLLVDTQYHYRTMDIMTNMTVVPYTFDTMISDFVRYTKETPLQCERDTLLKKLDDVSTDFEFAIEEQEGTTETDTIRNTITQTRNRYAAVENPTSNICAKLRTKLAEITAACEPYINQ